MLLQSAIAKVGSRSPIRSLGTKPAVILVLSQLIVINCVLVRSASSSGRELAPASIPGSHQGRLTLQEMDDYMRPYLSSRSGRLHPSRYAAIDGWPTKVGTPDILFDGGDDLNEWSDGGDESQFTPEMIRLRRRMSYMDDREKKWKASQLRFGKRASGGWASQVRFG